MVYIFLAEGFEEMEALSPLDILRRTDIEVKTVGIGGKRVEGRHGIFVEADITEAEAVTDGLDMIILPGGVPGTPNLEASAFVQGMIDNAVEKNLWIAAICAAPSILGHKKLLEGRTVTCYPGYEDQLGNAKYTGGKVELDGKIITSRGPGVAIDFGLKILECLAGKAASDEIRTALQC